MLRDKRLDIVKGIAIIMVVACHSGFPLAHFFALFLMASFFVASGYFYKNKYSKKLSGVGVYVKRKLISLWVPYVLWTAIFSFLHNFFISINVYTNNPAILEYVSGAQVAEHWTVKEMLLNVAKSMLLRGTTEIGVQLWFLTTLLEISLAYCFVDYFFVSVFKSDKAVLILQSVVSIVLLMLGYVCYLKGLSLFGMDRMLSFYCLFHGGYLLNRFNVSAKERSWWKHALIFSVSLVTLMICNEHVTCAFVTNKYGNPAWMLLISFMGWHFLFEIACLLDKLTLVKDIFARVGQDSLSVLILHFLCFKVVTAIVVLAKGLPRYLIAAFPYYFNGGCWWLAYTAAGVTIPVLLKMLWDRLKTFNSAKGEEK